MTGVARKTKRSAVRQPHPRATTGPWPENADGGVTLIPVFERQLKPAVRDLALVGARARCLLTGKTSSRLVDIDVISGEETRRIEHLPRMGKAWFAGDGSGLGIRRTAAIGRGETELVFIDADGHVTRQTSVPDATSEIVAGPGRWYVGCRNGGLYVFGCNGQPMWVWETPGSRHDITDPYSRSCPYYVMAQATGVVVTSYADIYAIDTDGRVRWHAEVPEAAPVRWEVPIQGNDRPAQDDAYQRLGLSHGADHHTVKSAYRRLARAAHPDHHPDDPAAASKFAEVRHAYECVVSGDSETGAGVTLTIDLQSGGPTVTFLATRGDTVLMGSSQGRVYDIDPKGRVGEVHVLGDGLVRAARRLDGTLGVAACGNELLFVKDNRVAHGAPLIDEPRRMTMLGEDVVVWRREAIQLVDVAGRVRWSAVFAKPVTHVVAQGDTLVCAAGAIAVFHRARARERHADTRVT